jgi:MFS family permease
VNRDDAESHVVTPAALGRFVTRTRRGRRAAVAFLGGAVALGLVAGLLNALIDLPDWVGVLCLVLFVGVTVPVLFRMVRVADQSPSE